VPYYLEHGNKINCIVAAPQCPENKYWSTDNWFDSLFGDLCHKYKIDSSRIYLTGISMGGYGTWQLAVEHPDIFAAIVPLCGGCNDSALICRIRNIPVWTFHGEADDMVPISETEGLVRTLTACKGNVKFTRIPNQGHGIQYLYLNNDIYEWLLTKRKKSTL
jgi:predicted peptidase